MWESEGILRGDVGKEQELRLWRYLNAVEEVLRGFRFLKFMGD